ncbi:hypothetical protein RFI_11209 [Reticulomyxa filosa]|uniref:Uncharacterized protein n=1 Tax=Reticulomyxa filosa TaxID=46433 RepID=X6NJ58_RETFI|nr:hypothetical protein RFI_11209 [Reticulomyxa filosa]|eukprot:ETO25928.1 hypothetical protein RFI_11209 [Reticulomyxa filosa]
MRNLLRVGQKDLTENITAVYLRDCDILLGDFEEATKDVFKEIRQGIPCGMFSNSWCQSIANVSKRIVQEETLIDLRNEQTFCHWFSSLRDRDSKDDVLSAETLFEKLRDSVNVQLLDTRIPRAVSQVIQNFISGKLQYLICCDYTPVEFFFFFFCLLLTLRGKKMYIWYMSFFVL